jgi:hypothetical protein
MRDGLRCHRTCDLCGLCKELDVASRDSVARRARPS